MARAQHDPSDDARRLREGDPEAARRLAGRLRASLGAHPRRGRPSTEEQVRVSRGDRDRTATERFARVLSERLHRYDDAVVDLRAGTWEAVAARVAANLVPATPASGWGQVRVAAAGLDERDYAGELPVHLGRPHLAATLQARLELLLEPLPEPFRGLLRIEVRVGDTTLSRFEVAARVGGTDGWAYLGMEEPLAHLRREVKDLRRDLREEREHRGRMFGNASGVIGATAHLVHACAGLAPVQRVQGAAVPPELLSQILTFGSELARAHNSRPGARDGASPARATDDDSPPRPAPDVPLEPPGAPVEPDDASAVERDPSQDAVGAPTLQEPDDVPPVAEVPGGEEGEVGAQTFQPRDYYAFDPEDVIVEEGDPEERERALLLIRRADPFGVFEDHRRETSPPKFDAWAIAGLHIRSEAEVDPLSEAAESLGLDREQFSLEEESSLPVEGEAAESLGLDGAQFPLGEVQSLPVDDQPPGFDAWAACGFYFGQPRCPPADTENDTELSSGPGVAERRPRGEEPTGGEGDPESSVDAVESPIADPVSEALFAWSVGAPHRVPYPKRK